MLPPKIGDGVLGSNCGGVNPTGASFFVGASDGASVLALIVVRFGAVNLSVLGVAKDKVDDFEAEKGGVKREA